MRKIDILLVRACKSGNPRKRLSSIYKRFYSRIYYGVSSEAEYSLLSNDIMSMLERSNISWGKQLTNALYPKVRILNNSDGTEYWEYVLSTLVRIVRYSDPEKFKGYIAPSRFRTKRLRSAFSIPHKESSQ